MINTKENTFVALCLKNIVLALSYTFVNYKWTEGLYHAEVQNHKF